MKRVLGFMLIGWSMVACPADPVQKKSAQWLLKVDGNIIPEDEILLHWSQRHVFEIEDAKTRQSLAMKTMYHLGEDRAFLQKARSAKIQVSQQELQREIRQLSSGFSPPRFKIILHQENWTEKNFERQVEKRLMVKKYLHQKKETLSDVTSAEIKSYYDNYILPNVPKEEIRARHILVDTKEEATFIREKLFGGNAMPFDVAARRFSKAPEADRGGEMKWFGRGTLPQVFDLCFDLKDNTISKVVESEYGFHLLKVLEHRKGQAESLEQKQGHIEKVLRQSKEEKLIQEQRKALAEEIKINIHEENLVKRLNELYLEISSNVEGKDIKNEPPNLK